MAEEKSKELIIEKHPKGGYAVRLAQKHARDVFIRRFSNGRFWGADKAESALSFESVQDIIDAIEYCSVLRLYTK